ncbi:MAG: hypothetical protein IPH88_16970 [Bacteroidales bacterium]|nr:hypothetical protein [Bacteroidales bacterium]
MMLEGMYDPITNQMIKAQNGSGNVYEGNVADKVTIEIRDSIFPII